MHRRHAGRGKMLKNIDDLQSKSRIDKLLDINIWRVPSRWQSGLEIRGYRKVRVSITLSSANDSFTKGLGAVEVRGRTSVVNLPHLYTVDVATDHMLRV